MRFRVFEFKYILMLIFLLTVIAWATSCNPTRQAKRKLQRAERLINKAKSLDPSITITDTVEVRDTVFVQAVKHDTTFIDVGDTVTIEKERLKWRYFRDTVTNEIFISGECMADTVVKTIKVPCEVQVYKETFFESIGLKLRWWHKFLFWIALIIAVLLYLYSKFKPF